MKEAYYFSHDSNARTDPKISAMIAEYGFEGYGWYWALLEIMREDKEYKINISSKAIFAGLALQLQSTKEKISEYINLCIDLDLFVSDENFLWSESFLERMALKDEKKKAKSEQARRAANARYNKNNKKKETNKIKEINKIKETNKIKEINSFYTENGFGLMGSHILDQINSFLDDGVEENVIIEALKIASENSKASWNYAKAILNDWLNKGHKTLKEVTAYLEQRKVEKKNKAGITYERPSNMTNFEERTYDPEFLKTLYEEV